MALSGQVIDDVGGEVGIVLDDQDVERGFMSGLSVSRGKSRRW
jgi:hypothetical protein